MGEADMQKIYELFKKDRFAAASGVELVKVEPGFAEANMTVSPSHLNGYGSVMGGAIFTLADFAFAAASNAKGRATVSSSASISYFHPPKGSFLTAKATEVSSGGRLCTYDVLIYDAEGTLCARYTGSGYITKHSAVE